MKPSVLVITALMTAGSLFSQTCKRTVITDDFSSASGWTSVGSSVNITNGACTYVNAYSGDDNRIYKNLGTTLSDTYCKAECELHITPNSSSNGAGAVVMALTAGPLDFMSYPQSQSYAETTQDGMAVVLFSPGGTDNNMNNWQFVLEGKKGNVRLYSSQYVSLSSATTIYYLRLERSSANMLQLSVFNDPAFSTHVPGSPTTFSINPAITGLNTLQHGVFTPGIQTRLLNGSIDNDRVCDDVQEVVTGIKEAGIITKLNCSPNPFSSQTSLELDKELPALKANITDITGKSVQCSVTFQGRSVTVDRSGLNSGIYFLQLFSEGQLMHLSKLVVE